jgi:hypothetical protein
VRMFRFIGYFFIALGCIGQAVGSEANVQCPSLNPSANIFDASRLFEGSRIAIEKGEGDAPVVLVLYHQTQAGCDRSVFARYSIEGGTPFVESLFFEKIDGRMNVFAIVSWRINNRGEGTYGRLYQVYAYKMNSGGLLTENARISNNDHMTGIDGYEQGQQSTFQYKTAADVKRYLKNKIK